MDDEGYEQNKKCEQNEEHDCDENAPLRMKQISLIVQPEKQTIATIVINNHSFSNYFNNNNPSPH